MNTLFETYVGVVAAVVLVAGGAFWGGMAYQAHKSPPIAMGSIVLPPPRVSAGANAPKTGAAIGQVVSTSASGFTVKMPSGAMQSVVYTSSTTASMSVTKTTALSPKDIAVGENVFAPGVLNPDGSITAQQIQVTPAASKK